jgi:hypothetical protein
MEFPFIWLNNFKFVERRKLIFSLKFSFCRSPGSRITPPSAGYAPTPFHHS